MAQHSQLGTYVSTPGGYWSGCRLLAKVQGWEGAICISNRLWVIGQEYKGWDNLHFQTGYMKTIVDMSG